MKRVEIEFILQKHRTWIPDIYYPEPASKIIPEWYKKMSSFMDTSNEIAKGDSQTMKRCMPVFDAMTAGYLIKTYTDINISKDNEDTVWGWAQDIEDKAIETHPAFQIMGYKNTNNIAGTAKFSNPWGIKTPKGYSCLFIHPPHREKYGGRILEGVVDTDNYHAPVNFPFELDEGFEGLIPAGTPIALVIPFKRESFKMQINTKDDSLLKESGRLVRSTFMGGYRNKYRINKEYR